MKESINIIAICALLMLVAACKQNVPDVPQDESPVFGVLAKLGSDSIKLLAGVEGNYMFASYKKDVQGRTILVGSMAQNTCDTCGDFVAVQLYANTFTAQQFSYAPSQLYSGAQFNSFSLDTTASVAKNTITCIANATGTASISSWQDNFGANSLALSPSFLYTSTAWANITMNYVLHGEAYAITNKVKLSNATNFGTVTLTASTIDWSIAAKYNGPGKVIWYWGDGSSTANSSNATHGYTSLQMPYVVTAVLVNGIDSSIVAQRINFLQNQIVHPGFSITPSRYQEPYSTNASAAILMVQKAGKRYVSYNQTVPLSQSAKPVLTITNIADAQPTPNGSRAKLLEMRASLYLYNVVNSLDSLLFVSDKMKMGVAVP